MRHRACRWRACARASSRDGTRRAHGLRCASPLWTRGGCARRLRRALGAGCRPPSRRCPARATRAAAGARQHPPGMARPLRPAAAAAVGGTRAAGRAAWIQDHGGMDGERLGSLRTTHVREARELGGGHGGGGPRGACCCFSRLYLSPILQRIRLGVLLLGGLLRKFDLRKMPLCMFVRDLSIYIYLRKVAIAIGLLAS